jgi:shikimate kinase/3-dehydroquinate synthase
MGFMGAGKSTALRAARDAGLKTTEIDPLMERELGMPITEAFQKHGEEEFRRREAEVVGSLLDEADGGAIGLGGGSILSQRVRDSLVRHIVVWLQIDAAEAWRRIEGSGRPLATSLADVERLLEERVPLYELLADAVIPVVGRSHASAIVEAVQRLTAQPDGTRMLWAASASASYPAYVGPGLLERTEGLNELWPAPGRRFCVSDETVAELYADRLEPLAARVTVPPGEGAKTLGEAERVMRELAQGGMTRRDHVVALGGGVVGDLAGFCAASYGRGVPVVHVPTTLLAQVDSAYGGKTGVDLPEGKNLVGAYHQPSAVIADTETLKTLPREEAAAGFVEVLKTALLAGGGLWEQVRGSGPETLENVGALSHVVFACVRHKCGVVAEDERDSGLRETLNLGHTVGHGIEAATGYERYRHGEAVGLGLLAALRLSDADELRVEVEHVLERFGLPVSLHESVDIDAVLEAVGRDKKKTAEGVGFVLLKEPGQPRTGQVVDPARVREAVEELRR